MTTDLQKIRKEKYTNGLYYGLIAGLAFSLALWGYDGYILAKANVYLPWFKLLTGGLVTLIVFGFAGWLTARADRPLVSIAVWFLAGFGTSWFAAHLPFEGLSLAVKYLLPKIGDSISYPFTEGSGARLLLVWIIMGVASVLLGLFELVQIDSAAQASSPGGRIVSLSMCVPIALIACFFIDGLINEPFRVPFANLDESIRFTVDNRGKTIDKKLARDMHVGAFNAIAGLLDKPHHVLLQDYDDTLVSVNVLIDFDGEWATCSITNNQLSYCQPFPPSAGAQPAPAQSFTESSSQEAPADSSSVSLTTSFSGTIAVKPLDTAAQTLAMLPAAQADLASLANIPRYSLEIQVDFANRTLIGQELLVYTNTEEVPLDALCLRLFPNGQKSYGNGSLTVQQVTIDDLNSGAELSLNNSVLKVKLPQALAPGKSLQLGIAYSGQIPLDFGGSATPAAYGIYNLSKNVMTLSGFFPILAVYDAQGWNLDPISEIGDSVYSETAFFDVTIVTPKDVVIAATGSQLEQTEDDKQQTTHYVSGPVRDFFITISPDFQQKSLEQDGVTVNSYFLPGYEKAGEMAADAAAKALHAYNSEIGAYPYRELDIIQAPLRNALGVEFPGIVLIGSSLYDKKDEANFPVTIAHEVAHQWWYNVVGNDVLEEPWLDEALATFSSGLYMRDALGQSGYDGLLSYWQDRYNKIRSQGGDEPVTRSVSFFENGEARLYGGIVYVKGALFFDALEKEIGQAAFQKGLQDYYRTYKYRIAVRQNLLDAFEKASGRSLDTLTHKWLFSP